MNEKWENDSLCSMRLLMTHNPWLLLLILEWLLESACVSSRPVTMASWWAVSQARGWWVGAVTLHQPFSDQCYLKYLISNSPGGSWLVWWQHASHTTTNHTRQPTHNMINVTKLHKYIFNWDKIMNNKDINHPSWASWLRWWWSVTFESDWCGLMQPQ